jgi:hypothetical protein
MGVWRSFAALDGGRRRLAAEATLLLGLVRIGLRILSFPTLQRALDRCARWRAAGRSLSDRGSRPGDADEVAWAVSAVARRLPGPTTCLAEALAAVTMLRARGHAAEVRFGVERRETRTRALAAHAWVECDGRVVVGVVHNLAGYAVLSASEHP